MKRNKKAFTLAEALIALGIISTIAAVTIPVLVHSTNSSLGARAERTARMLETGISNVLARAQSESGDVGAATTLGAISDADMGGVGDALLIQEEDRFKLFDSYGGLIGIERIENDNDYRTRVSANSDSNDVRTKINSSQTYRIKKLDTCMIITPYTNTDPTNDDTVITTVYIDGNGMNGENRIGADIIEFNLLNDGTLHRQ